MITFDALPILFSLSILHPHPPPTQQAENQHFHASHAQIQHFVTSRTYLVVGRSGIPPDRCPSHAFVKVTLLTVGADHGDEHFVRAVAAPSTVRSRR